MLFLLARNIVHSQPGRAFSPSAKANWLHGRMGVNLAHYKTIAFCDSAPFMQACPGGCSLGLAQFVNPDAFVFPSSILYVTMAILGGINTLTGAAIGGAMLTAAAGAFARCRGV